MNKNLRIAFLAVILSVLLPMLIILPLSFLNFFGRNSTVLTFISLTSIFPIAYYLFASQKAIREKESFDVFLSVAFYLNFIIFMIAVLAAFNFIIIGGFLFGGEAPIGMDLEQSQAPYLILLGIYLIFASSCGMYYVSKSKKQILS